MVRFSLPLAIGLLRQPLAATRLIRGALRGPAGSGVTASCRIDAFWGMESAHMGNHAKESRCTLILPQKLSPTIFAEITLLTMTMPILQR